MGFRTLCIESRCKCSYRGGYLVVTRSDETTRVHLSEIESVTFATTQAYVSAHLMQELAAHKISVVFCDGKQLPAAESLPLHGTYNGYAQLKSQLEWGTPMKKRVWQRIVRDKIRLQAQVLMHHGDDVAAKELMAHAADVRSGDVDNREAVAAASYFRQLFGEAFTRECDCAINASLNYGYSIVLSRVAREISCRGYLNQLGIHHKGELNPFNLACDLMEPFRPYVDRVVLDAVVERFDNTVRHRLIAITADRVSFDEGDYKLGSVIGYYVKDCIDAIERKRSVADIRCYSIA